MSLALLPSLATAAPDKSGVKPQVLSLPSGPGSIEGLGGSFEPQLNTGTSAYNVALVVPPGINGLQPSLALTYDSGAGNGHFGLAWKLPLESIHRQFDKGQPEYGPADIFVYSNGEELVPLADDTWRCENESDFMRFRQDGDGWEVRDRSGRIYHLGTYPNGSDPFRRSRVQNPDAASGTPFDRTFKWYVDAIEDTNGNRIEFYYAEFGDSPGELYVSEIRYNQHGGNYQAVIFDYEDRPDAVTDYRPGFRVQTARRGSTVRMESLGALVREYRLSYEDTAAEVQNPAAEGAVPLRLSLLSKVTQFDRTGRNFLPPLRLGYTTLRLPAQPELRVLANAPQALAQRLINGSADLLDVDGDGLPDVLDTTEPVHRWYPNLGRDRFDAARVMGVEGDAAEITGATVAGEGSVLADLDGDGLSDLLREPGDTLFRNRGDGSWDAGAVFDNLPLAGITGPNLRLLDVNFDKATDIVVSVDASQWLVCENPERLDVDHPPFGNFPAAEDVNRNGTAAGALRRAGEWDCRTEAVDFPEGVAFSNPQVQLADMNGDRIQDVVWTQPVGATARLVRYWPGAGGVRFDEPVTLRACVAEGACTATVVDIGQGILDANLRLLDVNGDGLSDLIAIGRGFLRLWVNLGGDEWSPRVDYSGLPDLDPATTAVRFADVNGNGSSDVLWIRSTGVAGWQYMDFAPQGRPNQLALIDNGLGRRIFIEYGSSTDFMVAAREDAQPSNPWSLRAPFPLPVVTRVVTKPSLELDGKPGEDQYVTEFAYRDAYYDPYEQEFRGFAFVKKIERGDADAPTQVTRIWFHTGAPDDEDNDSDGAFDERTEFGGLEEESLKGRILRQQITDAGGGADSADEDGRDAPGPSVFSTASNDWAIRPLHAPDGGARGIATLDERSVSFAFNSQSENHLTEQGRGDPRTIRTRSEYDDFGNLTVQAEEGAVELTGDERYTTTSYVHDETRWIVDRPMERTMRALPTEAGAIVTQSRFHYDGEDYVGLPLGQVTRGNLSREEAFVSDGEYVQKVRKRYDSFGNIIGIMDGLGTPGAGAAANGHLTEVHYEPVLNSFPARETIHVGGGSDPLVMQAEYDLGFGVITASIDFNEHRTTYGHDSFGRLTSITKPLDSQAYPTQTFDYHMADPFRGVVFDYARDGTQSERGAVSPSFVSIGKREQHGEAGTFDVREYVDGVGRKLGTVEEGETAFVMKHAVRLNARGMVRDTHQPFETGSPDYDLNFSNHFATTVYDAIGRHERHMNPPERNECATTDMTCRRSVRTEYRPLGRTIFDELNNEMAYFTDGLVPLAGNTERLIEVQEVNEGDRYHTFYDYNPADSLLRIEDAQQNVKLFAFDGLQRKTFANDPNRGVTTSIYDAGSNLVETVDAKGQRIVYSYDGLNRLISEDYKDEGLPFSANRAPDVAYYYDEPMPSVEPGDASPGRTATNTRGFLSWISDPSGEEHKSYDRRGRVQWVIKRACDQQIPDDRDCNVDDDMLVNYKTELAYDAMDRVTDLVYPDNDAVRYTYNARALPERIEGGPAGCFLCEVNYRPSGQQGRLETGDGAITEWDYDPRFRVTGLRTNNMDATGQHSLIHYSYTLDAASNLTRIDDLRPAALVPPGDRRRNTQLFEYDDLYRLTRVQYSFNGPQTAYRNDGSIDYQYDRIGNMRSQHSAIDHVEDGQSITNHGVMRYGGDDGPSGTWGRIGRAPGDLPGPHAMTATHDGDAEFAYDDNGNMVLHDGAELQWDFKDRLVSATESDWWAQYSYDYADRRVGKRVVSQQGGGNASRVSVLYINRYFEMREDRQPVKYIFNGDVRVARTTGSLSVARERVQRVRLEQGWNLVSLLVQAEDAGEQLAGSSVESVYRWDSITKDYTILGPGESLAQGTILWIKASQPSMVVLRGRREEGAISANSGGGEFGATFGFEAVSLNTADSASSLKVWFFDAVSQEWQLRLDESLSDGLVESDAPDFIAPGQPVAIVADGDSKLVQSLSRSQSEYFHQDHLGSSDVVTDSTGEVLRLSRFYPFGHPRVHEMTDGGPTQRSGQYLFVQNEQDQESGLQFVSARYSAAMLGRFISVDPIEQTQVGMLRSLAMRHPQRLHPYSYATNRPLTLVDQDGESAMVFGALLGAAVGGAVNGAFSAVKQAMEGTGSVNWDLVKADALEGVISGAVSGAVVGAVVNPAEGVTAATLVTGALSGAAGGAAGNFTANVIRQVGEGGKMDLSKAGIKGVSGAIGGLVGGPLAMGVSGKITGAFFASSESALSQRAASRGSQFVLESVDGVLRPSLPTLTDSSGRAVLLGTTATQDAITYGAISALSEGGGEVVNSVVGSSTDVVVDSMSGKR